jgi:3-deoxy-D-manno-octulosonic acid kinase
VLLGAARVRAAVRGDLAPLLGPWLLAPRLELPADAEPIASGRGGAYRVALPGGVRAVVRLYRRGGLLAHLVHETYLGFRPRPLRELAITAEARRRGVAAVEVLAARVEGRLAYRGALVTAEVAGATTLFDALRATPAGEARRALAARAGEAVAALHAAGVSHADLNLNNILVHGAGNATGTVFVDFDRARLSPPPLGAAGRRRNLRRLARSLRKLDPGGLLAGPEDTRAFQTAYGAAAGEPCAC